MTRDTSRRAPLDGARSCVARDGWGCTRWPLRARPLANAGNRSASAQQVPSTGRSLLALCTSALVTALLRLQAPDKLVTPLSAQILLVADTDGTFVVVEDSTIRHTTSVPNCHTCVVERTASGFIAGCSDGKVLVFRCAHRVAGAATDVSGATLGVHGTGG